MSNDSIDSTKILSRAEITTILSELQRLAKRSVNSQQNLVIFRLAACCGLRVMEIQALELGDIVLSDVRPHLRIQCGKRGKKRRVPLWLDAATLGDIAAWKSFRQSWGATESAPFICNLRAGSEGSAIHTRSIQYRFHTILEGCLPSDRARQLSIHSARHSFASHCLKSGFSLVQVRDWLGHSSISITSIYLHCDPDEGTEILNAFDFSAPVPQAKKLEHNFSQPFSTN